MRHHVVTNNVFIDNSITNLLITKHLNSVENQMSYTAFNMAASRLFTLLSAMIIAATCELIQVLESMDWYLAFFYRSFF